MNENIKKISTINADKNKIIRDKIIEKLSNLETKILTLNKENKQNISNIKKEIVSLKNDIKIYGDVINIQGYETYFIKKHIEKYEGFFLKKIME